MIGRLSGILIEKTPPLIMIDCHGVGYEVNVSMSTFYNLPATGDKVTLLTHLAIREDAHVLYGFEKASEREAFRQLLKVSGIGARTALAILSGMSVGELVQTVSMQEVGRLTKVPGIGKKTAERLLLELKGKLVGGDIAVESAAYSDTSSDVLNALEALGYSDKEARLAIKTLPADVTVSEGIKLALKALSKA